MTIDNPESDVVIDEDLLRAKAHVHDSYHEAQSTQGDRPSPNVDVTYQRFRRRLFADHAAVESILRNFYDRQFMKLRILNGSSPE
jgi:hypothetical protein